MEQDDRFDLSSISALVDDVERARTSLAEGIAKLREAPKRLAESLPTVELRMVAAHYLYWNVTEIPAKTIGEHLLGCKVHEITNLIGGVKTTINCDRCGDPMQAMSRTALAELQRTRINWPEGYRVVCNPCREAIFKERSVESEQREQIWKARMDQLRSMPYREYLRTPEWDQRRKQHLKSAGYRCQVCNAANAKLQVHHRTYERRGYEYYKDLIVLCENCHGIFHTHGDLSE